MKRLTCITLSLLMVATLASTAFAAKGDKELDLGIGFATAPYNEGDLGWGLNFGGGYEFHQISASRNDTLQLRGDIGYNSWSGDGPGYELDFNRLPVSAGCRYYYPIRQVKNLRVFGQASLELSFDSIDEVGINFFKDSDDEVNLGLTPGVGVEYLLNNEMFVHAEMKEHLISDPYFTMHGGIGVRF